MLGLVKSSIMANKRNIGIMLAVFISVTIFKLEMGLVVALYIIIKIGKSISDYNYFCDIRKMFSQFPRSKTSYSIYCLLNNNLVNFVVLIFWISVGIAKSNYDISELIYFSVLIYIIVSMYSYIYDLSEIKGRSNAIENTRKIIFIGIAAMFICISRIPNLYKQVNDIVFNYSAIKLIISVSIAILINFSFYMLFFKELKNNS
ncbi:hypothetical protein [Hathewaya massiliensis]|uniref:hypothetical protein n=1 Tax=Hathewaya massiliensis TaxID=1964382 RepID=UPI001159F425|nr:hypothetical protein [Hathewaya massiliensis]